MKYPVTPMDFAMAGLSLWRMQAQTAAMTAMQLTPTANTWPLTATDALERISATQVELAAANKRASLAILDAATDTARRS